jgi:hypothetical protein
VLNRVEGDARAECMGSTGDKDYTGRIARRRGRQDFGREELREEEWADVVSAHLALETVGGQLERPDGGGRVVDEDLTKTVNMKSGSIKN